MRECDAMTRKHPLLMTSSKDCGSTVPPVSSTLATASVMILALVVTEHLTRALLFSFKVRIIQYLSFVTCCTVVWGSLVVLSLYWLLSGTVLLVLLNLHKLCT